ncbi:PREDICTED: sodium/hydrogen exchanger 4 isoform X1 [Nicotiana attenuata]|uniref:Sodiumhydrogen exchanger 4 n=1 Tax=Nicotiana attenuata TaxID=49451 RepID=A0A1J6IJS2_NICAT|nr:PREDICTED: sodium/hydrogen exchanger 4 isoform X1 [Nicotiana attenuata]OIS99130.1 sodiumhydrogen exchanger 4 [Nicotiana attenuata]
MGKMALFDYVMDIGNSSHEQVVPMTVFVAILCLCLVIGHLLEENRWVNESITAIIIGCISGTIILFISKGKSSHILRFNEEVFFIYLLPPIIFNAGFQVKKKQFFHNFLTIMSFGVIGVFISSSIITAGSWWLFPKLNFDGLSVRDYLGIGAIFSSTDTVCTLQVLHQDETPLLYSLVFGEGVVNDATSVVLFNAVQKLDVDRFNGWSAVHIFLDFLYLFSTSTALGVAAGLLTSYILKGLYFGRHSSVREISLMLLMAYLSYMLAELFSLSGILTVFFSGILMSHYAWHNVTDSSRITTRHAFEAMSFIAETFIFLYVGMDALDIEKWKMSKQSVWTSMGIYGTVLMLIAVGRAAFVFPLSALSNFMNRNATRAPSITFKHQIVIWWAGLMRGAVSIALAFKQFTYSGVTVDPVHAVMVTTTVIVVLFSTLVFGFLTKPLINYLLPHHDHTRRSIDREPTISKDRLPLLSFEESATTNLLRAKDSLSMLFERPVYTIHSYWRRFDDTYMRPIFGGARRNESSESG